MKRDFVILREPAFRYLFLARTISLLGTSIAPIALAFAVLGQPHGSVTELGLVMAGRSVSQVVFLLYGGMLADRFPRYRVMIGSDVMAFVAQGTIAGLFISKSTPVGVLVGLAALNGAANALFLPASRGIVPDIVDSSKLQSANALISLTQNSSSLLGVAISGLLIVAIGPGWALAADSITFLVSASFLLLMRAPAASGRSSSSATMIAQLREGWHEFRSRQWVWVVVSQFALVNLCFPPSINVLGPLVAKEHWGGALAWSVILAAESVGLIAGSFVAMRVRPSFPMRVATVATFGFLPPFFLLAVHAPVWLMAASMLVNGLAVDLFEVLWATSLQEHVPATALSRVSSYDALGSFVLGPIGLLIVGPVSQALGAKWTLIAAGCLVAFGNICALLTRSVWMLPAKPIPAELGATRV